jgi:hypothetical protein
LQSLCPDTTHAIHDVIAPLFQNGIAGIMKLRYHAYGKVQESEQGLRCQHGPLECKINRYLNCAQELHPANQSNWFRYVACVHGNYGQEIEAKASEACIQERGWDKQEMNDCAAGAALGPGEVPSMTRDVGGRWGCARSFRPSLSPNSTPCLSTLPAGVAAVYPTRAPVDLGQSASFCRIAFILIPPSCTASAVWQETHAARFLRLVLRVPWTGNLPFPFLGRSHLCCIMFANLA